VEDVPLVEVHIGLLAHQIAVAATDTLDLGQGVHNLLLAIDLYCILISTHHLAPTQPVLSSPNCARSRRGIVGHTLVLSRRRMNWKLDFSPEMSDMMAVGVVVSVSKQ